MPESLRQGCPLELPLAALTRHVSILGATGSGKSTTATVIARGLASRGVSTVILDRTGEYATSLKGIENVAVFEPGTNLVMALFQFDKNASVSSQLEAWIGLLDHYLAVTYDSRISPLQSRVLREVIGQYYRGTQETLTISKLIEKLRAYEDRVRRVSGWEESIEAIISRLVPLTVDFVGKTFNQPFSTLDLASLFRGTVSIFDMSAITEDGGKNLLSQLVFKQLYQWMKAKDMTDAVSLVLILDEAQHLAPSRDYLSIPERCAIELRKYGFSLIAIATRPALVSSNILSNSGTVVSHLLVNERDIDVVSGFLLGGSDELVARRWLRTLSTGSAVVQQNFPVPKRPVVCAIGASEEFSRGRTQVGDGLGVRGPS